MKYLLFLLLLIGSAKGQDTSKFNGASNEGLSITAYPRETFSAELVVYDSMRLIGYQKKDSTLVIVGDSARFIRIILENMSWDGKFKVRYPKRIYQKKKHPKKDTYSPTKLDSLLGDVWIQANDVHTSNGDLIIRGKDVQLGGKLYGDTASNGYGMTGSTITGKAINFDSFYLSSHGLIPKYKDSISIKGYNWDFWQTPVEAYPWWKKALWLVFGQLTMLVTFLIINRIK